MLLREIIFWLPHSLLDYILFKFPEKILVQKILVHFSNIHPLVFISFQFESLNFANFPPSDNRTKKFLKCFRKIRLTSGQIFALRRISKDRSLDKLNVFWFLKRKPRVLEEKKIAKKKPLSKVFKEFSFLKKYPPKQGIRRSGPNNRF